MLVEITSSRELKATAGDAASLIRRFRRTGKLPARVTSGTLRAMEQSLDRYFGQIAADKVQEFADKARDLVEELLTTEQEAREGQDLTVTVGKGLPDARVELSDFIREHTGERVADTMNMDFFLRIAREVAEGAGQFVAWNADPVRVDEFPALELKRVYRRDVPRGMKRGPNGTLVPDPGNDWPARWEAAGGTLTDGRMIALKDDPIWQALGDGVGGYTDTLGNPFPPFAFNSGYDVSEVSRKECVKIGLIEPGQKVSGAALVPDELIATPTDASLMRASVEWRALHAAQAHGEDIPLSVKALIVDQGRLLVLKDARSDWNDLPGGHAKAGETLERALKREVEEETGLTLKSFKQVGVEGMTLGGKATAVVLFRAKASGDVELSDEHESFVWASVTDIDNLNLGEFEQLVKSELGYKKSDCMARCPSCGCINNIKKQKEISMGAVACELCGKPVTQEHLMQEVAR